MDYVSTAADALGDAIVWADDLYTQHPQRYAKRHGRRALELLALAGENVAAAEVELKRAADIVEKEEW